MAARTRTGFNETSEAIFLNSGYSYPSSQHAEDMFANKIEGHNYSRFANPTHRHVPEPHGAARRRRGGAGLFDRHVGGHQCGDEPGAGRRPYRRRARAVRRLPLRGRGLHAALRRRLDAGRRPRPGQFRKGDAAKHQAGVHRDADQSDAGAGRHRRRGRRSPTRTAPSSSSTTCLPPRCYQQPLELGADLVTYSATKHIDGQGRTLGGVVLGSQGADRRRRAHAAAPDRPVALAVQRLGAAQGPRNPAAARPPDERERRQDRRFPRRPSEDRAHHLPAPPLAPAIRAGEAPDGERLDAGGASR